MIESGFVGVDVAYQLSGFETLIGFVVVFVCLDFDFDFDFATSLSVFSRVFVRETTSSLTLESTSVQIS